MSQLVHNISPDSNFATSIDRNSARPISLTITRLELVRGSSPANSPLFHVTTSPKKRRLSTIKYVTLGLRHTHKSPHLDVPFYSADFIAQEGRKFRRIRSFNEHENSYTLNDMINNLVQFWSRGIESLG